MLIWTARELWTNEAGYSISERERTNYVSGKSEFIYVILPPGAGRFYTSASGLSEHRSLDDAMRHIPEGVPVPQEYYASDPDNWRPDRWRLNVRRAASSGWRGYASYHKDGDMNQAILHSPDLLLVEAQQWCQDVFDLLHRTFDFSPGWTNR